MTHLTHPAKFNLEDSNIALLGSDLEKRVRDNASDKETAWETAGKQPGLQIWRIEKFHVKAWPEDRKGVFYDGDSYIVLYSYKKDKNSEKLSYDLHFWLGANTSQDEAGTAAYKTVELDDHLGGIAVQYRELQGSESNRFLTHFTRFTTLHGGVSTGFHHISSAPPKDLHRMYQITAPFLPGASTSRAHIVVRQVLPEAASLTEGDVFVLDLGTQVMQLNMKTSSGKEKFAAAEFVRNLVDNRKGHCELTVYDESGQGMGKFLSALGLQSMPSRQPIHVLKEAEPVTLFRLSDASGTVEYEDVTPAAFSALSTSDAFLVDASALGASSAIYVWIGREATLSKKTLAIQYAQRYIFEKLDKGGKVSPAVNIVKINEGAESEAFLHALGQ